MTTAEDQITRLEQWKPPAAAVEPRIVALSPMLRNILESVCEAKSNDEIKDDWGIALDTVKTHMRRLLKALGARDRVHAIALVYSGAVEVRVKPAVGQWAAGAVTTHCYRS